MRLCFLIIIFIISGYIYSIDSYVVGKRDDTTLIGSIIEDKPGEYVIIEDVSGETWVIPYSDIEFIRLYIENPLKNLGQPVEKPDDEPRPEVSPGVEVQPEVEHLPITADVEDNLTGYTSGDLSLQLRGLTLYSLNTIELDEWKLEETDIDIKSRVYDDNFRDDTLKFTLLNIVPGLGSILQGDYYSGIYTLTSVLGAVAYNLASPQGTDITFLVNLNGAVAYLSSFFAPYRYNSKYNNLLKEKLDIAD